MPTTRRQFIQSVSLGTAALTASAPVLSGTRELQATPMQLSCNSYTWDTFYKRAGKQWMQDPDASLRDFVASGFTAYEPGISSLKQVQELGPLLKKYNLAMPSLYVNSSLHKRDDADASIAAALAIADAARPMGTRIVVTNPNPIKWGSPDNKTDAELEEQVRNLDRLGAELRKRGISLAYHTHAPEHRAAAREFHHMMLGSDPDNVKLCLDAHWVYRGSENSQVALFDVVKLYGKRIVELHVRQSQGGIWAETFTPTGDIDYPRLVSELKSINVSPLVVLEQCLETGSPNTMDGVAAHRQDLAVARTVFA
ncbi:sugar phosphate isomerase/epimerase family protein [uncultured Fibrella sp.]|uniref:sugar phosphate isomerase/epimerase family protein n=1 Tax=uncultured Fibrella sp. TaxID=1284596 RepID=UPI0035C9CE72